MIIKIDSREQQPFTFSKCAVGLQQAALPAGDYSIPGFEDRVAIERKTLDDLVACFQGENRSRFEKELAKAKSYELFAVIVEANMEDIAQGRYTSRMNPESALQSVSAFHVRHRVPFLFANNRSGAEYLTYSLLAKFLYEIEKRYKRATNFEVAQEN